MATTTTRLSLRKPGLTDLVNVLTDLNANFDKIDDPNFIAALAADIMMRLSVTGDANPRFRINAEGQMEWGDGTAVPDTVLERRSTGGLILPNGTIDSDMGEVDTAELASDSQVYVDLATVGPSATVTIGPSGIAYVSWGAYCGVGASSAETYVGVDISGANTIAPSDSKAIEVASITVGGHLSRTRLYTGLSEGVTTFKVRYKYDRGSAGTVTIKNRHIEVITF